MALKFSEMCAIRFDLALKLEATFENFLEAISHGYGAYLAPMLEEGESLPDIRLLLVLLRRKVEHHRQTIDTIDEGVLDQIHGDEKVRAEINDRTEAVDAKLRLVRSAYRGFYGLDNLGRVALEGDFPRGAVRLHRLALTVKTSLESPDLALEPLLDLDLAGDESMSLATQLGTQLEPELSRLGELLDERHQENTRTLDVRLRRQEVIREFDYNIRGIIRMAQGMFRLAGRNDLGVRIRPVLQRVLRKLEDQEAQEQEENEGEAASQTAEPEVNDTAETTEEEVSEEATA